MTAIITIIKTWDSKLTAAIRERYIHPEVPGIKPHSLFTVLAALSTDLLPFMMNVMTFQNKYLYVFGIIYKTVCILMILGLYVYAFYCWTVFLKLRRKHMNKDKNLFFSESATFYRKSAFYVALALSVILKFRSKPHFEEIRFQLRAAFYREAGITILDSIIFSILLVELSRNLFPKTFPWSNRTHYAVLIMTAVVMSCLRVVALNFASGHGII